MERVVSWTQPGLRRLVDVRTVPERPRRYFREQDEETERVETPTVSRGVPGPD